MNSFLRFVTTQRKRENYDLKDIGNMDETPVWIEMPGKSTLELKGKKGVRMMSTGHEKERITVVLSALADETKLAPFVLLPGIRPLPKEDIPSGIQVRYCFLSLSLSPSLSHSHTLCPFLSLTPSLPLSLSRTDLTLSLSLSPHSHSHTPSLFLSLTHRPHPLSVSFSLSHTHTASPSHLSHTHAHTHTRLSLSIIIMSAITEQYTNTVIRLKHVAVIQHCSHSAGSVKSALIYGTWPNSHFSQCCVW